MEGRNVVRRVMKSAIVESDPRKLIQASTGEDNEKTGHRLDGFSRSISQFVRVVSCGGYHHEMRG